MVADIRRPAIDCATDRKKVGLAVEIFEDGETVVENTIVCRKVDPHTKIREWLNDWEGLVLIALIALDAPLGWPDQMGGGCVHIEQASRSVSTQMTFFDGTWIGLLENTWASSRWMLGLIESHGQRFPHLNCLTDYERY